MAHETDATHCYAPRSREAPKSQADGHQQCGFYDLDSRHKSTTASTMRATFQWVCDENAGMALARLASSRGVTSVTQAM